MRIVGQHFEQALDAIQNAISSRLVVVSDETPNLDKIKPRSGRAENLTRRSFTLHGGSGGLSL